MKRPVNEKLWQPIHHEYYLVKSKWYVYHWFTEMAIIYLLHCEHGK